MAPPTPSELKLDVVLVYACEAGATRHKDSARKSAAQKAIASAKNKNCIFLIFPFLYTSLRTRGTGAAMQECHCEQNFVLRGNLVELL